MPYSIKEIFYTLQGEGVHAGRPAVFCRFAGCNLWSGREEERASAICRFCDTDFVGTDGIGGGTFASAEEVARSILRSWPERYRLAHPFVVCTGGEPLLQLDTALIEAMHAVGMEVAIETNGTVQAPDGIDWICVSPKANVDLAQDGGDELKLIYPQIGAEPEQYAHLDFRHFLLQPMDGPGRDRNIALAKEYCLSHPQWRLSLQLHKLLGLP
jgi:7-carboxy-7-deazaguanine synthase